MRILFIFSTNDIPKSNDNISSSAAAAATADQKMLNDISTNQSIVEVKSLRSLERTGTDGNEGYFIDDRSEININFQKYRMVFVVNKDAVFYKKSALQQARKVNHIFNFLSVNYRYSK